MAAVAHQNGLMSPPPTDTGSVAASPPRVVLAGKTGRILCVADIRGDYHELNRLIREHEATAVIHTGDFGFMNADSLDRMGDKILRHLLQYSPLIANGTRQSLLNIPPTAGRQALIEALNNSSIHFPLSQFPHLISGAITFPVPVFTVWGLIEDVRVLEKFRSGEYEVHNLSIIDEATSRVLDVGGLRLRLFGLGGAVAPHKMFDNGEGQGTIAGGQGTMWTTTLQMGELVDTAIRHFDPSETRLFISSACVSRLGILSQLSAAIKADLTISGGLHFRYPASFNDFSVHADFEAYRQKLAASRDVYMGIYASVKERVEPSLSENQLAQLKKALGVMQRVPEADDGSWTNTWHWVLSDASCGHLLFSINEGRVSAETHSQGLNFSHRAAKAAPPPSAPKQLLSNPLATPTARTAATPAQLTQRQAPTAAARPDTNAQPALPPPMSSANGSSAAGTASNPVVRPPGVSATPSARPSMGHQAVRPSFNGPNGSAMQNAQNQNQNQNAMGMQMRPGMMARPPLGGAKSGNAFGTPPAGLARPPQAPRAPRAVSGGQAQSQQGQAQGQVAKADDAKSTRPGPAAAAAASTNVKPASNAAAAAASTATPTVNGQEKRENRFAPLANVREPREPREPREAREPREPREVRERDVKGKDKKEGVNGTVEKGKKADKGEKKEEDKTKDAKDTAPSSAAGVKGKADKTERADKADKGERKDAKATATATTTAPAPAQAAKDTKPASAEKKDQEKEAAKKEEGPAAAGTTASAPASGAATPAGSDDKAQPQAKVQVHKPALFLKSVPAGTEEGDLRAMFGESKDKIQSARIVKGKFSKPDFAYIDFATDEDVTKALSECTKTIKDTEVSVVISNPPQKFHTGGRGGRGGMSRGGGGGRGGMRPPRTGSGAGRDGPSPAPPAAAAAAK